MSRANYKVRNRNAIKRGFEWLGKYEAGICDVYMRNIARDMLTQLLRFHDENDELHHKEEKNTLAYALAHDGAVVESGFHNGSEDDLPGRALEIATGILSGTHGWVAVVVSELEGWYNIADEEDMLHSTASEIQQKSLSSLFGSSEYLTIGAIPKPS